MKIILKSLLLSLFILQIVFFFFMKFNIDPDMSIRRIKFDDLFTKVSSEDFITLGDSTNMTALDPSLLGPDWKNLSLNCGGFYEDYIFMHRLIAANKLPKKVFVTHHIKMILNQENCFKDITLASNLFSWSELSLILNQGHLTSYYIPSYTSPWLDLILSKLHLMPDQLDLIRTSLMKNNTKESHNQVAFLLKNNGHLISGDAEEFPRAAVGTADENKFQLSDINNYFFEKMLKELDEKHIPVIFTHPPYSLYYKKLFESSTFLKDAKLYFGSLEIKYPNFKYDDEILYLSDEHFLDLGHASQKGAEAYSQWFKKRFVIE